MKHPYSDKFSVPPALLLQAEACLPRQHDGVSFYAKIDTAADISAVPRRFITRFKPLAFNTRMIRQSERREYSYLIEIELDGNIYPVEVVGHDRPYILIGRDILNQLKLIADGPNEVFELIHPHQRRSSVASARSQ